MSKDIKKHDSVKIPGTDSPKTLISQAKREVPDFVEHFAKFEQQMVIGGYSQSTLFNYSRAVAKISLYFKKSVLELDPDEVNRFLYTVAKERGASSTYYKHTIYGLRFFFRLYDLEDRVLRMPKVPNSHKLPNVFSRKELKQLLLGFNPSKLNFDNFWGYIHLAIERAEALDTLPQDRWPNELGSRVYVLMKKIMLTIETAD